MGLFDWLTDSVGSSMGQDATGTGAMMQQQDRMPPVQGLDMEPSQPPPPPPSINPMGDFTGINPTTAAPPLPPGGDPMTAGGAPGNGPGLPPRPPVPPYPSGGDPMTAGGPGLPPGVPPPPMAMRDSNSPQVRDVPNSPPPLTPTDASAAARSYQSAGGNLAPPEPTAGPRAQGFIGRALGLDPNREAQMRGSLGAGLKAAGENAHKPGLAAFAGSLGSGIEGGKGAADKTTEQQSKFLTQQIAAGNAVDTRHLNQARTELALAQAKQAMTGESKSSVVNSEQQLYLRAQSAAAQDGRLKALKTRADQAATQFGPDSAQAKAALKEHKDAYDETVSGHAKALGLDPSKAAKIGKQPGMSRDNPLDLSTTTQQKLNELPVGSFVIGKDGKVLVKKPPAGATPQAAPQSAAPPVPPVPVTAPAGSRADDED